MCPVSVDLSQSHQVGASIRDTSTPLAPRSGSPAARTCASTRPIGHLTAERVLTVQCLLDCPREAPTLPRTSIRPGRGPAALPRRDACRMLSTWVPPAHDPGRSPRKSACTRVDPSGTGPKVSVTSTRCGLTIRSADPLLTENRPWPSDPPPRQASGVSPK